MHIYFDLDSTLVSVEGFDYLAKQKNISSHFAKLTAQAMNGEIDFHQSFMERLLLLQASKKDQQYLGKYYLDCITPGVKELITELHKNHTIGIITYNFLIPTRIVAKSLGIQPKYIYANALLGPYEQSDLLDTTPELLIYKESKANILKSIKQKIDDTLIFVGDGYQDVLSGNQEADYFIGCGWNVVREKTLQHAKYFSYSPADIVAILDSFS